VLAQCEPERPSTTSSAGLRRGEEHLAPRTADPERAGDAAREIQPALDRSSIQAVAIEPRSLLERRVIRPSLHQGEDRLESTVMSGLGPLDRVPGEDLLVVDDDPVVDPDDGPCRIG
jgi:hypothetical protein